MVTGGSMQQVSPNMVVVGASMSPVSAEAQKRTAIDHRRSNKPIMEKRRRARINNCLNDLKSLILDAMKKDPARHSKLEKADILEMTVKHLETLRAGAGTAPLDTFRAGYRDCADEVGRYPGLDASARRRLLQHLASRLASATPLNTTPVTSHPSSPGVFLSTGPNSGVQLVPTRLSNGDIALVLPSQSPSTVGSTANSQMPVLVPIPSRTSSTASASSAASNLNIQRCYSPISPPPTAEWSPSSSCSSYSPESSTFNLPNTSNEIQRTSSPFSTTSELIPQPSVSPYHQHPASPYNVPRVASPAYQEVHQDQTSSYASIEFSPRPYSPEPAPLSLVIRKDSRCFAAHDQMMNIDDEKPWRPW